MKIAQVREFALSLPEVTEEPHFDYSSFRVRKKIFVTVPPEEDRIHVFVSGETLEEALEAEPGIVEELYWGKKLLGVRIWIARAGVRFVRDLIRAAYREKAPKSPAPRGRRPGGAGRVP